MTTKLREIVERDEHGERRKWHSQEDMDLAERVARAVLEEAIELVRFHSRPAIAQSLARQAQQASTLQDQLAQQSISLESRLRTHFGLTDGE